MRVGGEIVYLGYMYENPLRIQPSHINNIMILLCEEKGWLVASNICALCHVSFNIL